MKKTYLEPATRVIMAQTVQLLAGSKTGGVYSDDMDYAGASDGTQEVQ